MSAGVLIPVEMLPGMQRTDLCPDVTTSVSVRGDRQRLFQILTVDEYMEAWLTIPGSHTDSRLTVNTSPEQFRIDHFRSQQVDFRVTGTYRTCRRGKLEFTWRKESNHGSRISMVLIRLHGEFDRTKVTLTHTCLGSQADHLWHRDLWEASLLRLRTLF